MGNKGENPRDKALRKFGEHVKDAIVDTGEAIDALKGDDIDEPEESSTTTVTTTTTVEHRGE